MQRTTTAISAVCFSQPSDIPRQVSVLMMSTLKIPCYNFGIDLTLLLNKCSSSEPIKNISTLYKVEFESFTLVETRERSPPRKSRRVRPDIESIPHCPVGRGVLSVCSCAIEMPSTKALASDHRRLTNFLHYGGTHDRL